MSQTTIQRKDHHLDLCAQEDVEARFPGALFEDVSLIHEALPEFSAADVDLSCGFLGRRLKAPVMFTAITGGTERGGELNRALARAAQRHGLALGVGSQRAMAEHPEAVPSFCLRREAPDAVIVGNIGLWQARTLGPEGVRRLMDSIDADAVAIHLNVAQELIQPEGDRDFSGGLKVIEALVRQLGQARVLIKETGCGISPATAQRLASAGVRAIDIAGTGGTSWIKVEGLRSAPDGMARHLGALLDGWGIPTAPAVSALRASLGRNMVLVASGGVRSGLDVAKSIALGADLAGTALPCLRAWDRGGGKALESFVEELLEGLRLGMLLTGCRTLEELRRVPVVEGEAFGRWKTALMKQAAG